MEEKTYFLTADEDMIHIEPWWVGQNTACGLGLQKLEGEIYKHKNLYKGSIFFDAKNCSSFILNRAAGKSGSNQTYFNLICEMFK